VSVGREGRLVDNSANVEGFANNVRTLESEIQSLKLEKDKLKAKNMTLINQMNDFQDTITTYFESKHYQYTNADHNMLQLLFDQIDDLEAKIKAYEAMEAKFKNLQEEF
jgi:predicted RNase H-like nuclease (RuvC/YqgF family)